LISSNAPAEVVGNFKDIGLNRYVKALVTKPTRGIDKMPTIGNEMDDKTAMVKLKQVAEILVEREYITCGTASEKYKRAGEELAQLFHMTSQITKEEFEDLFPENKDKATAMYSLVCQMIHEMNECSIYYGEEKHAKTRCLGMLVPVLSDYCNQVEAKPYMKIVKELEGSAFVEANKVAPGDRKLDDCAQGYCPIPLALEAFQLMFLATKPCRLGLDIHHFEEEETTQSPSDHATAESPPLRKEVQDDVDEDFFLKAASPLKPLSYQQFQSL
jgi:hypothetical protein